MKEIWKPVIYNGTDYTGLYEVSNMGRIKSLISNRLLTPTKSSLNSGYHLIGLSKEGVKIVIGCHVLVWSIFMSEPKKGLVIHHKDSNGLNNKLSNLDCITHRSNFSKERTIKSGLPVGVRFQVTKQKYQAQIRHTSINSFYQQLHIGYYDEPYEAAIAYKIALKLIKTTFEPTKEDIKSAVSEYRESIGLKRLRINKTT